MKTLKYRSNDPEVYILEEILSNLGYNVAISEYFGKDTHDAVMEFQKKNNLVVDGIVGVKTWAKLVECNSNLTRFNDKFLSEKDIVAFAETFQLEIPVVKAVNAIESSGKGFLLDGRPRILFEGHIFWSELKKRGINPSDYLTDRTKNVLYSKWTKSYYEGGEQEYDRLEKAAGISDDDRFHDAAYCAASWGAFQIMGFHFTSLGYPSVDSYVAHMYTHEKAHLDAFGRFCKFNGLLTHLQKKEWAKFAKGYNGSGYKENKYDTKLEKAYNQFKNL